MGDQIVGLLSPWLRERRFKAVSPYLAGRILDFGCGIGMLSKYCDNNNYVGLDADEESIEIAEKHNPGYIFCESLKESERFDTIVALALIEHVADPGELINNLYGMLNSHGRIVLTTPHPHFRKIDDLGSKLGILSPDKDEHHDFIDKNKMNEILFNSKLKISLYRRFLFGANQIFVLKNKE